MTGLPLLRAGDPEARFDGEDEAAGRSGEDRPGEPDGRPRGDEGTRWRPRGAAATDESTPEGAAAVVPGAVGCDGRSDEQTSESPLRMQSMSTLEMVRLK